MSSSQGHRDMRALAREVARTPGWTAVRRRNGHWHFRGPDGQHITASGSPSDRNGPVCARRDLIRVGWKSAA
jgi:hypothetical protein